jgi:hypothetical protein
MQRVFVIAGVWAYCSIVHASPCQLADLAWLEGSWRSEDGNAISEERWIAAPGDRLVGSYWLLHKDKPGGVIEANTIQMSGDAIALRLRHFNATLELAREEKDAPMVFLLAECDQQRAVFDGLAAQAGEHMTYHRNGDRLTFVGDFLHQGQPIRVEVTMQRAPE